MVLQRLRAGLGASGFALGYGYLGLAYGIGVAIAFTPSILSLLGPEAFGLAGLLITAQACFQFLDAGISPTANREAARFRGGAMTPLQFRDRVRSLECLSLATCFLLLVIALLAVKPVAAFLLNRETLTISEVQASLAMMAAIVLLRLLSGFRRGLLYGFERHKTVTTLNIAVATFRYPMQVVFLLWASPSATHYFQYQLLVSVLELLVFWLSARPMVPRARPSSLFGEMSAISPLLPLMGSQMFLAVIWILASQTDKVMLSGLLKLSEFGHFSLATTAAAGVLLASGPITQMLQPRLARLYAEGRSVEFQQTYRRFSRINAAFLASVSAVLVFFGEPLVYAWTGDRALSEEVAPVLALYAMGNAVMGMAGISYLPLHARGRVRLHVIGTLAFAAIIVPALYVLTRSHGMVGAGYGWVATNLAFVLLWVPVSHRSVYPGLHIRWLLLDVLGVVLPAMGVVALAWGSVSLPLERWAIAITVLWIAAASLAAALASASLIHKIPIPLFRLRT